MNEYDIGNHLEFYGYQGWPYPDFDPEFEASSAVWIEDQEEEEQSDA